MRGIIDRITLYTRRFGYFATAGLVFNMAVIAEYWEVIVLYLLFLFQLSYGMGVVILTRKENVVQPADPRL